MKAQIGIVDDHPALRLGVASILNAQDGMFVAATVGTATELVALGQRFDGILLDLALADDSTPAGNIKLLELLGAPVLVFTSGDKPDLIRESARAGAAGMLRKSAAPHTIVSAVRTLLRGDVVASADWAAALEVDPEFLSAQLSPREAEVLGLYAAGETAERVANLLYISRETVLDHIRRIRLKYASVERSAPTKVDLYRRAVEDGIVFAGQTARP